MRVFGLLTLGFLIVGCSHTPAVIERRMSLEDIDSYEIDCKIALQQINFLNNQKTSTSDMRTSRAEVSKFNFVAKLSGLPDNYTPNSEDYRQIKSIANNEYNHLINYKIEQINQYCLGGYENPNICYSYKPNSPACIAFRRSK